MYAKTWLNISPVIVMFGSEMRIRLLQRCVLFKVDFMLVFKSKLNFLL